MCTWWSSTIDLKIRMVQTFRWKELRVSFHIIEIVQVLLDVLVICKIFKQFSSKSPSQEHGNQVGCP